MLTGALVCVVPTAAAKDPSLGGLSTDAATSVTDGAPAPVDTGAGSATATATESPPAQSRAGPHIRTSTATGVHLQVWVAPQECDGNRCGALGRVQTIDRPLIGAFRPDAADQRGQLRDRHTGA
jgi:hypothetical protein